MGDDHTILNEILGLINTSIGPVIAMVVILWITQRNQKTLERAAQQAGLDALKAQEAADLAKMQAANAMRHMIVEARGNASKLDTIIESSHETHSIVNNQRSEMIRTIDSLKAELQSLQARIDGIKK